MVGGKVTETFVLVGKSYVWINVQDGSDKCAIYVENSPEARAISEGDSLWWQGGYAYWTAKNRRGGTVGKSDYRLKRVGYSGVKRPKGA